MDASVEILCRLWLNEAVLNSRCESVNKPSSSQRLVQLDKVTNLVRCCGSIPSCWWSFVEPRAFRHGVIILIPVEVISFDKLSKAKMSELEAEFRNGLIVRGRAVEPIHGLLGRRH
jgi:hypothetical protein